VAGALVHLAPASVYHGIHHPGHIAHGAVAHRIGADAPLEDGQLLHLRQAPRVGDGAGDVDIIGCGPYANLAYRGAATVRLLDDALLPIREYHVL
jgi:hypothetical protein